MLWKNKYGKIVMADGRLVNCDGCPCHNCKNMEESDCAIFVPIVEIPYTKTPNNTITLHTIGTFGAFKYDGTYYLEMNKVDNQLIVELSNGTVVQSNYVSGTQAYASLKVDVPAGVTGVVKLIDYGVVMEASEVLTSIFICECMNYLCSLEININGTDYGRTNFDEPTEHHFTIKTKLGKVKDFSLKYPPGITDAGAVCFIKSPGVFQVDLFNKGGGKEDTYKFSLVINFYSSEEDNEMSITEDDIKHSFFGSANYSHYNVSSSIRCIETSIEDFE